MTSYCEYVRGHPEDEYNSLYHDQEYGFPLTEDNLLEENRIPSRGRDGYIHPRGGCGHNRSNCSLFNLQENPKYRT